MSYSAALSHGAVIISGGGSTSGGLTDEELRAVPVAVSDGGGSLTVDGTIAVSGTVPVSGPLTDAQLRASTVAVSGPLTDAQLRASTVPVADGGGSLTVDGTVTANIGTTNGLALDATLTGGSQKAKLVDSAGVNAASVSAAGALKVDGSAATQPVSGSVSVSNFPASQAVTGPLTDAQIRASAVPVSGSVSVSNFPASQAVTGPVTDAQLRASAVPVSGTVAVTGTFWQATQPVSAASLPLPSGAAQEHATAASPHAVRLTDGVAFYKPTTPSDTQPVSGTVSVSNFPATQAVTGPLTDTQLRASALPVSGTVTANQGSAGANAWKVDGSAVTQPVSIAATVNVAGPLTDTQLRASAVPVSGPTLTKGTQSGNGFSVQDLKDAGRVWKTYSATFTGVTTEALLTLTPIADGTAGSTGTSFAVTAGKKLRLVSMSVSTRNAGAAGQGIVCNLRVAASGAVTASSPLVASAGAGTALAIANVVGYGAMSLDLELSGTMQFGVSQIGTATAGNTFTLVGYEY